MVDSEVGWLDRSFLTSPVTRVRGYRNWAVVWGFSSTYNNGMLIPDSRWCLIYGVSDYRCICYKVHRPTSMTSAVHSPFTILVLYKTTTSVNDRKEHARRRLNTPKNSMYLYGNRGVGHAQEHRSPTRVMMLVPMRKPTRFPSALYYLRERYQPHACCRKEARRVF
jgi:hypothetical protein